MAYTKCTDQSGEKRGLKEEDQEKRRRYLSRAGTEETYHAERTIQEVPHVDLSFCCILDSGTDSLIQNMF